MRGPCGQCFVERGEKKVDVLSTPFDLYTSNCFRVGHPPQNFVPPSGTTMRYCRVQGCRHAGTHVTCAHRCGTCGRFGHGRMECERPRARATLDACPDTLPVDLWCPVQGCNYPWTHTMEAHFASLNPLPPAHLPLWTRRFQPSQSSQPPSLDELVRLDDLHPPPPSPPPPPPPLHSPPPTSPTTTVTLLSLPPAYRTPPRPPRRPSPRAPPRLVQQATHRTCPHCKTYGRVDLGSVVYTGADCSICFESNPCVVFEACRHANVCATCAERLS